MTWEESKAKFEAELAVSRGLIESLHPPVQRARVEAINACCKAGHRGGWESALLPFPARRIEASVRGRIRWADYLALGDPKFEGVADRLRDFLQVELLTAEIDTVEALALGVDRG